MLTMTTTKDANTTGVKDIAEALGGGIHEDSLIIIEGESKTGKSVLSQHLAHGILHSRKNAIAYYTTESSIEELIAQLKDRVVHLETSCPYHCCLKMIALEAQDVL